jgi:hypothetical protein
MTIYSFPFDSDSKDILLTACLIILDRLQIICYEFSGFYLQSCNGAHFRPVIISNYHSKMKSQFLSGEAGITKGI